MSCDRDADEAPSPCCAPRPGDPSPLPVAGQLARACEDALLGLLIAPAPPPDAIALATVRRARALLREAAATPGT